VIATFFLLWSCLAANATERLAVLEFQSKTLGVDERTLLTDEVRGSSVKALAGRIQIMTRENMEVMLTDMGMDADCVSEGACEVETARNLGVDYVVSGTVLPLSGKQVVSLKLHRTETGELLASERAQGDDAFALLDAINGVTIELLAPLGVAQSGGVVVVPAVQVAAPAPVPVPVPYANPVPVALTGPALTHLAPKPQGKGSKYNAGKTSPVFAHVKKHRGFGVETSKRIGQCRDTGSGEWNCHAIRGSNVYVSHNGTDEQWEQFHDAYRNDKATTVVPTELILANGERLPGYDIATIYAAVQHHQVNIRSGSVWFRCISDEVNGCPKSINELVMNGPSRTD